MTSILAEAAGPKESMGFFWLGRRNAEWGSDQRLPLQPWPSLVVGAMHLRAEPATDYARGGAA